MLLERNQAVVGAVVAVVLLIGTVMAVTVSGGAFASGTRVEAEFADAAGLSPGDFVFVAGVRAGEVLSVDIDGEVARARFTVDAEGVPADSGASIIIQNTLGKRAIRIDPGGSATALAEGDVIPLDRTATPIDLPQLGDESAELLGEVDVEAFQSLTTALADITEGKREDVELLLDGIDEITAVVVDRKAELEQLLQRSETFIAAAADKDQEIVRIIDAFGSTLDRLAERRTDVTRLLAETAATTDIAGDLLEDREEQLDRILYELHEDLTIVDGRQVDLAHGLAYLGVSINGFASIGYGNGPAKSDNPTWGSVFVTGLGAAGVDALLGCGGTLDELFTELIGPDPRCDERRPGNPPNEPVEDRSDSDARGSSRTAAYPGLGSFFTTAGGPR